MFNPSSPNAVAVSFFVKSKICKNAKVSQSGLINEKSVIGIMEFAEYSLSILKDKILTLQVGRYRRQYVFKLYYLLRFVSSSLSKNFENTDCLRR